MPFVVSSFFYRCDDGDHCHGVHFRLEEAVGCLNELKRLRDGEIPIHPISGKYMQAIIAVDREGNQRDFTRAEKKLANCLGLDSKSVYMVKPGITTFYNLAKMYIEALRLLPMLSVDLEGLFDYQDAKRHFWNTDAGKGQAIAYTQQAIFTLELSLKAILEVHGKIAKYLSENKRDWRTHDLAQLFGLLPEEVRGLVEGRWDSLPVSRRQFHGTFSDFLTGIGSSYTDWRYIPELKSSNFTVEISSLLAASTLAIDVASISLRKRSPYEVTSSGFKVIKNGDTEAPEMREVYVEGLVVSVKVPESLDPFSKVEVVIKSDHHEHDITALFYKLDVERYYRLKGERVFISGYSSDAEPHLLEHSYLYTREDLLQHPIYESEHLSLRGSVYNVTTSSKGDHQTITTLTLWDTTYFTEVSCILSTDEERNRLAGLQLGDEILIGGLVTLKNGRPLVLAGADFIERVEEESTK